MRLRRLSLLDRTLAFALLYCVACGQDPSLADPPLADPLDPPEADSLLIAPALATTSVDVPVAFAISDTSARGNLIDGAIEWSATGGTIGADGVFVADSAGSYEILGRRGGLDGLRRRHDGGLLVHLPDGWRNECLHDGQRQLSKPRQWRSVIGAGWSVPDRSAEGEPRRAGDLDPLVGERLRLGGGARARVGASRWREHHAHSDGGDRRHRQRCDALARRHLTPFTRDVAVTSVDPCDVSCPWGCCDE